MTLNKLKPGETVFIDANIFIYHFTGLSNQCKEFLKACSQKKYIAFSSTTILAEVTHRLMAIEAVASKVSSPKNPTRYLSKHPEKVRKLTKYFTHVINILNWNIEILSFTPELLIKSQIYRDQFGLLTNDSFIPVFMEQMNSDNLATADRAFTLVPNINVFQPMDL